jgi:hypothetical protein
MARPIPLVPPDTTINLGIFGSFDITWNAFGYDQTEN